MFRKTVEDFACAYCGAVNVGTGYTNHCHECLWSRHVDVEPGDRASECGGLMRPVAIEGPSESLVIRHVCERCGFERRNKVQEGDSREALVALARERGAAGS